MKKAVKILLAIAILAFVCVFIVLNMFFKPVAETGLRSAGFKNASVGEAVYSAKGSTLKNIKLDAAGNTIGEVLIFTDFADLKKGRISEVHIKDAKLKWPLDLPKSGAAGPLDLRLNAAALKNVELAVDTPYGALPFVIDGTIFDAGEVYQVKGTAKAETAFAKINASIVAVVGKASRRVKANIALGESSFATPGAQLSQMSGAVEAMIEPGKPLPALNGQLDVKALVLYGVPMEGSSLAISSKPEMTTVALKGNVLNNSGNVDATLSIDHRDTALDKMALVMKAALKDLVSLNLADIDGEGSVFVSANGEHVKDQPWDDIAQWKNLTGVAGIDLRKLTLPGLFSKAQALATVRMKLEPETQRLAVVAQDGDVKFQGALRALSGRLLTLELPVNNASPPSLVWDNKGKTLQAEFVGGQFSALDFMGRRVNAKVTATLTDTPALKGSVDIGELRHNASLPHLKYFIPVRAKLQMTPGKEASATLFKGEVTEAQGRLYAKLEGKHDSAAGKGSLSFNMPPTAFNIGVAQVANVFPVTVNYFRDAFGVAGLTAKYDWSKAGGGWKVSNSGELYLKDMQLAIGDTVLTGVSTAMKLESLTPAVMRDQSISVDGVNMGLPLTEGVAVISLDGQRNLTVHSSEWAVAGGKITTQPFILPLDTKTTRLTLNARGLDLQQLFQIAPLEGLNATGTVDGSLPIYVDKGEFSVREGTLQTTGTGTIRYNPQNMPAFLQDTSQKQIVDLKAALTAFNYESLAMTINGEVGKTQQIALRLRGKNPLFYGGKPVNFNLNVEGPIENIIRYSPGSSRIPDSIRKQMEAYEAAHGK